MSLPHTWSHHHAPTSAVVLASSASLARSGCDAAAECRLRLVRCLWHRRLSHKLRMAHQSRDGSVDKGSRPILKNLLEIRIESHRPASSRLPHPFHSVI